MIKINCPDGWNYVKLSDLGIVARGRSKHRPRHAPHLYNGPYPFIQTGDVKAANGRITEFNQTYNETGLEQSRLWPKGTICITIAANIAETAILQFEACFPDSIIGFIYDEKKCNLYFIEFMFRYLKRLIQFTVHESGSVQDNINLQFLENLYFPVPDLQTQDKIAEILHLIDDKIHLNNLISKKINIICKLLYNSLFIEYHPMICKTVDSMSSLISNDILDLFPNEYENTILGEIPRGWQVVQIKDILKILTDSFLPLDYPNEIFAHYSIPAFDERKFPLSDRGISIKSTKNLIPDDVVLLSKINPDKKRIWIPYKNENHRSIASTEFLICRPKKPITKEFLYYLFQDASFQSDFVSLITGTSSSHQRVKKRDFLSIKIVIPNEELILKFTELIQPLVEEKNRLLKESIYLKKTLSILISQIMTGKLDT